jgi:hypothetical protein
LALLLLLLAALASGARQVRAQDTTAAVELDIDLSPAANGSGAREPIVITRNLLEDTPWLSTLREGLPVRLQYRLEVWRSREGWFDVLDRQIEWTVVVRHEPLLDQFSVIRLLPPKQMRENTYATPGALASALSVPYKLQLAPKEPGRYYYAASLAVSTLSDSDMDQLERVLRGELDPGNGGGASLAQRVRRLVLRLAGLPTLNLSARSEGFEVRR